ncbi:bile acid-CoA:amino acid N-acyltransferase-like isoform X2 [Littorina saxatilis]|uniref:Uncharacterized protein n=1 Tax=Littorina saxatilis TaxID=31220 RepID=A0AAN9GEB6_9CAEN
MKGSSAARLRQLQLMLQKCSQSQKHASQSQQRFFPAKSFSTYQPVIKVTPKVSLFDQEVLITVHGLTRKAKVTLQAWIQHEWRREKVVFASYGHFVASEQGEVDLSKDSPVGGTFTGIEPMGLLWSLAPLPGHPTDIRLVWKDVTKPCDVHIALFPGHITPSDSTVCSEDPDPRPMCVTTASRWMKAADVSRVEIKEGRLRGMLFLPPGEGPHPGVIDVFGSAGGLMESRAALLASHGFAVLSLAFFNFQDLPKTLEDVQLDYFEEAVEWFSSHPAVREGGIGTVSVSFGATFAMLTAMQCPQVKAVVQINGPPFLIMRDLQRKGQVFVKSVQLDLNLATNTKEGYITKDALLYSPSDLLPMWKSSAHMLCLVSDDDGLNNPQWIEELRTMYPEDRRHLIEVVHYPGAGHLLEPPYTPHCRACMNPAEGKHCVWGGNPKQHSEAQRDSWQRLLAFLHDKLR